MKHQRIATTVTGGHLPAMVRRQIAILLSRVADGTDIVIEMFEKPVRRSMAQNDYLHAAITPWAREEGHSIDDLKRDLLGEVFGWEGSPLGVSRIPKKPHTSQLTKEEFSELIERMVQIAAECGHVIQLPDEYNAAKWLPENLKRTV